MEHRILGRTGVKLSVLGFGCGAVGGSWCAARRRTRREPSPARWSAASTTSTTAAAYGDGASETNLGRVLKTLRPDIFLSTKFTILPEDHGDIAGSVARSLEASLRRLGRDRSDLLQLHKPHRARRGRPAARARNRARRGRAGARALAPAFRRVAGATVRRSPFRGLFQVRWSRASPPLGLTPPHGPRSLPGGQGEPKH